MLRSLFSLLCVIELVSAVCNTWDATHAQGLIAGRYNACMYISNNADTVAVFHDTGVLALHHGVTRPQDITATNGVAKWVSSNSSGVANASPYTLHLSTNGVLSIRNNIDDIVWSSLPVGTPYPGLPTSPNMWSAMLEGFSLSVLYAHTPVWKSTTGVIYAASMPVGSRLTPNQYIQSNGEYLLSQLDGNVCTHNGAYPVSSGTPTCLKPV